MTSLQSEHLAKIRAQNERFRADKKWGAEEWDTTFLLRIIDEKNAQIRELERKGSR